MIKKVTWEQLVEEYPKLVKHGEKYEYLKEVVLKLHPIEGEGTEIGVYRTYKIQYKSAFLQIRIQPDKIVILEDMARGSVHKIGPVLILGVMYFINHRFGKLVRKDKHIFLKTITPKGLKLWLQFLKFESEEDLVEFSTSVSDYSYNKEHVMDVTIPFKRLEERINEVWKWHSYFG